MGLSWKVKLRKGTGDLREPTPILQAGGSISEILAQIGVFSEKENSAISALFTLASLIAAKFRARSRAIKRK